MSFDGSFTHSMRNELASILKTGRVSKINQPYPNELILTIRAQSKNQQLLLSANPTYARVQLTKIPYSNPSVPSNFTMIMRKHLSGAILTDVQQLDNDRVLKFLFTSRNELGDQTELCLNVEIMARHSNIILVDQKKPARSSMPLSMLVQMSTAIGFCYQEQLTLIHQSKTYKIHLQRQALLILIN